jgi:hypothetical protein
MYTNSTHTHTHTQYFIFKLYVSVSPLKDNKVKKTADGYFMIHAGLLILWLLKLDGHTPQMRGTRNMYIILVSANMAM